MFLSKKIILWLGVLPLFWAPCLYACLQLETQVHAFLEQRHLPLFSGELGERLGVGKYGKVYAISHPQWGENLALKIYEPSYRAEFSFAELQKMAASYQKVYELLPEHSLKVFGLVALPDGRRGLVMERIPHEIKTYAQEHASEHTAKDLAYIGDVLLRNGLMIVDFSFTITKTGRVKLFDLDHLQSWEPSNAFYNPKLDANAAQKRWLDSIKFWIERAREDASSFRR